MWLCDSCSANQWKHELIRLLRKAKAKSAGQARVPQALLRAAVVHEELLHVYQGDATYDTLTACGRVSK